MNNQHIEQEYNTIYKIEIDKDAYTDKLIFYCNKYEKTDTILQILDRQGKVETEINLKSTDRIIIRRNNNIK